MAARSTGRKSINVRWLGIVLLWRTAGIAHDELRRQQNRASNAGTALDVVDEHSGRYHPDLARRLTDNCKPRTQQS